MSYIDGEKTFKISESKLKHLIHCRVQLEALEAGGVDNWGYYSDSFKDYVDDYFDDKTDEEKEDLSTYDIAEIELKKFEEVDA